MFTVCVLKHNHGIGVQVVRPILVLGLSEGGAPPRGYGRWPACGHCDSFEQRWQLDASPFVSCAVRRAWAMCDSTRAYVSTRAQQPNTPPLWRCKAASSTALCAVPRLEASSLWSCNCSSPDPSRNSSASFVTRSTIRPPGSDLVNRSAGLDSPRTLL